MAEPALPTYLTMFGVVGVDFTAETVRSAIIGVEGPLVVRVHSGGGACREAMPIVEALLEHAAKGHVVSTVAEGVVAGAAMPIFQAGTHRVVMPMAHLGLTGPVASCWGATADVQEAARVLVEIEEAWASVTAAAVGPSTAGGGWTPRMIRDRMKSEFWKQGALAVAAGLADTAITDSAVAPVDPMPFAFTLYRNAPEALQLLAIGAGLTGVPEWASLHRPMVEAEAEKPANPEPESAAANAAARLKSHFR